MKRNDLIEQPTNLYERLTFPDSTQHLSYVRFEYG